MSVEDYFKKLLKKKKPEDMDNLDFDSLGDGSDLPVHERYTKEKNLKRAKKR